MNRFIADIKRYRKYSVYAAKSQLKTEVANSFLNWLWWILEPFCFMLIYAFIFGYLFKRTQQHFNVYIFVALALWDFFNRCIKSSVRMVRRNKAIVSKVYLPKYALIISDMMVNAFKMLICLGIVVVMLVFYRVPVDWHIILVVPVLATTIVFTFGCCCILLHLGVFIEDMSNVINIVLRFVFYLTGIFYNIEASFPEKYAHILLTYNPMAFFIDSMRKTVMYCSSPNWVVLGIWAVISLALAVFGVRNIYKNENTYVKVI